MTSGALERGANFEYGADPHPKGPASASINADEVMNRGPRTAEEVSGRCSAPGLASSRTPLSDAASGLAQSLQRSPPAGGGTFRRSPHFCHRNREGIP